MEVEKLEVGDVVDLKCGGPQMVISKVFPQGQGKADKVECCWYVEPSFLKEEFDARLLNKA